MSGGQVIPKQAAAKVTKLQLLSIIWILFAVSFGFFVARLYIRMRISQRLFTDDYIALLALLILLANTVIITLMSDAMFMILDVTAGGAFPMDFMERGSFYLKCQFASTVLFWSCLWAVKASFLAFFKRLMSNLKPMVWAWWTVVAITLLGYIGSVISYPISCTSFVMGECNTPRNVELSLISLRFSTVMDIATDMLIIALPLTLAVRVRLPLKTKIALAGVFCLGGIVALFAIVRIIVTNTTGEHPEISWLNLWSSIECSVAVVVCCLAPFKVLFSREGRGTGYSGGTPYAYGSYGRSRGHSNPARKGAKGTYDTQSAGSSFGMGLGGKRSHAQVTAIPLTERPTHDVFAKNGTIMVTRETEVDRDVESRGGHTTMWNMRESQESILEAERRRAPAEVLK